MIDMTSIKKRAYASAAAVSILWGLSFIGSKRATAAGLTTFSLVTVRFIIAALAMLCVAVLKKENLRIRPKDALPLAATSISGITLYYYCELNGLRLTSASVASLIIATIPALSLLTGIVLHGKKPAPLTWFGLALSLVGVYLVVFSEAGENTLRGFLFMFGACLCWIVYLELTDSLLKRYSSLTVTFWQSVFALISLVPLALTETVPWTSIPLDAWLWTAVFLGLICSCLCYLLNNFSVRVLSPQTNAFFLNLSPVATAIGGYLVLGESITLSQLVGGVIILASLLIVSLSDRG